MTHLRVIPAFSALACALVLTQALNAFALTVPETPPSIWSKNSFGVSASSEYFMSKANYDTSRGHYESLPTGNEWSSFETRGKLRYGVSNTLSFFTGLGFGSANANDAVNEKTNASLTEIFAGADFLLVRRWWRVVPEFEVSYPLEETTPGQSVPLTSDGVPYARAGVFLFKPYKYLRFESYLGFHFPGQGLSKRFTYSLATEVAVFGAFTVGAGVQGYESLISDDQSYAQRRITAITANATSDRFFSYNPALIEGKLWLGLRLDRAFNVRLGYLKTVNGVRAGEGQSLLLSLNYNSPGNGPRRTRDVVRETRVRTTPTATGTKTTTTTTTTVAPAGGGFRAEPEVNDPELFDGEDPLDNTERLFDRR